MEDSVSQKKCKQCENLWPATPDYFDKHPRTSDKLKTVCKKCLSTHGWIRQRPVARKGYKFCAYCGKEKEATLENFSPSKNGVAHVCRGCWKDYVRELAEKRAETYDGMMWECTKCERSFPRTSEFFFHEGPALRPDCKECSYKRARENYKENEEERKAHRKVYTQQNKQKIYLDHKQYIDTHPEKNKMYDQKKRTKRLSIPGEYTDEQIRDLLKRQKQCCYYCHIRFKYDRRKRKYIYEVEHTFPLSRVAGMNIPANDISYIVLSCADCNDKKFTKFPWEWPEGGRLL